MKDLPIGIQTFELLRKEDYIYADKTKQIYKLAQKTSRYFLSRPRRFGKSLLCSTFEALFQGKKELFKNLWIENSDWDWQQYPVIHLDFTEIAHSTPKELEQNLSWELQSIANKNNIDLSTAPSNKAKFSTLVKELSQKNPVVLLIDEYDKPITDHLTNIEVADKMRQILRDFYGTIKALDKHLQFVFLTGVTKFAKVSIFSGLNNLDDITIMPVSSSLLGYTQEELEKNFSEHIDYWANQKKISRDIFIEETKMWYNGYCFFPKKETVYNPHSILSYFKHGTIKNFWFQTGTPSFLIDIIKKNDYPIIDLEYTQINESNFEAFSPENLELFVLLFQTGYLTIKDYNPRTRNYILSYPNYEVREAMTKLIITSMTTISPSKYASFVEDFRVALEQNNIDGFCQTLQTFLSGIPYTVQVKYEKYFQSIFLTTVRLIGFKIDVEIATNIGRIDAVVEKDDRILIFEFKVDKTPELAIEQIKTKKYYEPYRNANKPITLIGISFNSKEKTVSIDRKIKNL